MVLLWPCSPPGQLAVETGAVSLGEADAAGAEGEAGAELALVTGVLGGGFEVAGLLGAAGGVVAVDGAGEAEVAGATPTTAAPVEVGPTLALGGGVVPVDPADGVRDALVVAVGELLPAGALGAVVVTSTVGTPGWSAGTIGGCCGSGFGVNPTVQARARLPTSTAALAQKASWSVRLPSLARRIVRTSRPMSRMDR